MPAVLDFEVTSLDGKDVELSEYAGKVVMIVNVASRCGATPQYEPLQALYEKYEDKGFVILGFPCNQFGAQEPGSATAIREFCTENYGVTFPMFSKIDVNGDEAAPLYQHLTSEDTNPENAGEIGWNFEKFLISRDGEIVGRFTGRARSPTRRKLLKPLKSIWPPNNCERGLLRQNSDEARPGISGRASLLSGPQFTDPMEGPVPFLAWCIEINERCRNQFQTRLIRTQAWRSGSRRHCGGSLSMPGHD